MAQLSSAVPARLASRVYLLVMVCDQILTEAISFGRPANVSISRQYLLSCHGLTSRMLFHCHLG